MTDGQRVGDSGKGKGRKGNTQETVRITISTTPQVIALLNKLAKTGLYGKNTTETAERIIAESLRNKVEKGEILAD